MDIVTLFLPAVSCLLLANTTLVPYLPWGIVYFVYPVKRLPCRILLRRPPLEDSTGRACLTGADPPEAGFHRVNLKT